MTLAEQIKNKSLAAREQARLERIHAVEKNRKLWEEKNAKDQQYVEDNFEAFTNMLSQVILENYQRQEYALDARSNPVSLCQYPMNQTEVPVFKVDLFLDRALTRLHSWAVSQGLTVKSEYGVVVGHVAGGDSLVSWEKPIWSNRLTLKWDLE